MDTVSCLDISTQNRGCKTREYVSMTHLLFSLLKIMILIKIIRLVVPKIKDITYPYNNYIRLAKIPMKCLFLTCYKYWSKHQLPHGFPWLSDIRQVCVRYTALALHLKYHRTDKNNIESAKFPFKLMWLQLKYRFMGLLWQGYVWGDAWRRCGDVADAGKRCRGCLGNSECGKWMSRENVTRGREVPCQRVG